MTNNSDNSERFCDLFGNTIKSLATSKKFLTVIASVIVAVAVKLGINDIEVDQILAILSPAMAYIMGQGIADIGKEQAKVTNSLNGK